MTSPRASPSVASRRPASRLGVGWLVTAPPAVAAAGAAGSDGLLWIGPSAGSNTATGVLLRRSTWGWPAAARPIRVPKSFCAALSTQEGNAPAFRAAGNRSSGARRTRSSCFEPRWIRVVTPSMLARLTNAYRSLRASLAFIADSACGD